MLEFHRTEQQKCVGKRSLLFSNLTFVSTRYGRMNVRIGYAHTYTRFYHWKSKSKWFFFQSRNFLVRKHGFPCKPLLLLLLLVWSPLAIALAIAICRHIYFPHTIQLGTNVRILVTNCGGTFYMYYMV